MNKLIVENRTAMDMADALAYVSTVVSEGRISNGGSQYCYHTVFKGGITVSSFLNAKSDRLVVSHERAE